MADVFQQFEDGGAAIGVARGGDEALGLVKQDVDLLFLAQRFAVEKDAVPVGVDPLVGIADRFAVHLDAAAGDDGAGVGPAGDAGLRNETVERLERLGSGRLFALFRQPPTV